MKEILDLDSWMVRVSASMESAAVWMGALLPKLVMALLVLGLGWLLARLVQAVGRRVLRRAGVDRLASASRVGEALRSAGVTSPLSAVVARVLFWALLLTFGLFALQALGVRAVGTTLEKVIGVLPQVFAAIVIAAVGVPLGRLVRNLTTSTAAAVNLRQAARLGAAAQAVLVLVVIVLALSQVGVDTGLLITVITTLVATFGLSMGLAFALGARPIVTHILAGHFLRQHLVIGAAVGVLGKTGKVRTVGPVATVLSDGNKEWVVPNHTVLSEVLER